MTFEEDDKPPEDVLSALRADGERPAPAVARTRVLSRLGVAVAAGAATMAHATAASAAASKTAGASIPAGGAVGLALTKSLVLNPVLAVVATLGVGSSVGIVAYQAVEPGRAPVVVPAPANAPQTVKKTANGAHEANARDVVVSPAQTASAPAASAVKSSARLAPTASERRTPPAELAPAPDLPATSEPARLAEQQALLDQARASLRRGDGAGALAILAGHDSLYPVTEFAEERGAIRILSLVMTGQADEARRQAERFERRFPSSMFLPSIRRAFGHDAARP